MGKLDKCDSIYSKERIEEDIRASTCYDRDPKYSLAYSNSAIAKTLYNIMCMMDKEGE